MADRNRARWKSDEGVPKMIEKKKEKKKKKKMMRSSGEGEGGRKS